MGQLYVCCAWEGAHTSLGVCDRTASLCAGSLMFKDGRHGAEQATLAAPGCFTAHPSSTVIVAAGRLALEPCLRTPVLLRLIRPQMEGRLPPPVGLHTSLAHSPAPAHASTPPASSKLQLDCLIPLPPLPPPPPAAGRGGGGRQVSHHRSAAQGACPLMPCPARPAALPWAASGCPPRTPSALQPAAARCPRDALP